jgi:hypothetical protein
VGYDLCLTGRSSRKNTAPLARNKRSEWHRDSLRVTLFEIEQYLLAL